FYGRAGVSSFYNHGTLRKAAGAGTTEFRSAFTNDGTVEVLSGQLRMGPGGGGGTYLGASGTELVFVDGHALGVTSVIDGDDVTFEANSFGRITSVQGSYRATGTTKVNLAVAHFTGSVLGLGDELVVTNFATADFGPVALFVPTIRLLDVGRLTGSARFTT